MYNKNNQENYKNFYNEDYKEISIKTNASKFESDLYREDEDVPGKSIRVKRIYMPNKSEKWKVFEDTKVIFVLDGESLSKKERSFLKTVSGMNFLISQFKNAIPSISHLKKEIKKQLTLDNS